MVGNCFFILSIALVGSVAGFIPSASPVLRRQAAMHDSRILLKAVDRRLFLASRREMLRVATAGILAPTLPALAQDSAWADHSGSFAEGFFGDFKTSPTGFAFKFLSEGEGDKPAPLQKVYINYCAYLLDGTKVESTYDAGEPFDFRIGAKNTGRGTRTANDEKVIVGLESVVGGMKPGMRVIVKVPPEFAYGSKGSSSPAVPPGAPVVYYVELVELGGIKGDRPRLPGEWSSK